MLNYKVGDIVCKIATYNKDRRNKYIYINRDENNIIDSFPNLKLDTGKFQVVQNPDNSKRFIHYISGPSGSGKSYWIKNLCQNMLNINPKYPIFLISALSQDETLDQVHQIKRILLDEKWIEDPITINDLPHDCMVIFDDCDVIHNKKIKEEVYKLLDQILETGRHFNISCCVVSHLTTNGKETRRMLNECHTITIYPNSGSFKGIHYLLKNYVGLDNKAIDKIKNIKSRWITIYKHYPQLLVSENEISLLNEL